MSVRRPDNHVVTGPSAEFGGVVVAVVGMLSVVATPVVLVAAGTNVAELSRFFFLAAVASRRVSE